MKRACTGERKEKGLIIRKQIELRASFQSRRPEGQVDRPSCGDQVSGTHEREGKHRFQGGGRGGIRNWTTKYFPAEGKKAVIGRQQISQ